MNLKIKCHKNKFFCADIINYLDRGFRVKVNKNLNFLISYKLIITIVK